MIDFAPLKYRAERMRQADLSEVMEIERASFTAPWTLHAFEYELQYNEAARYFVVRPQTRTESDSPSRSRKAARAFWTRWLDRAPGTLPQRAPIAGYGGLWKIVDEAHISTIAVAPESRGRGLGELLLVTMIDASQDAEAKLVTLEVRKSNEKAIALYRKYHFDIVGERKRYYSDNGEDAWIMTTPEISTARFVAGFQHLRTAMFARLAA